MTLVSSLQRPPNRGGDLIPTLRYQRGSKSHTTIASPTTPYSARGSASSRHQARRAPTTRQGAPVRKNRFLQGKLQSVGATFAVAIDMTFKLGLAHLVTVVLSIVLTGSLGSSADAAAAFPVNSNVELTTSQVADFDIRMKDIGSKLQQSGLSAPALLRSQFGFDIQMQSQAVSDSFALKILTVASLFPENFLKSLTSQSPTHLIPIRLNSALETDGHVGPDGHPDCLKVDCFIEFYRGLEIRREDAAISIIAHEFSHLTHAFNPELEKGWRSVGGWIDFGEYARSGQCALDGSNCDTVRQSAIVSIGLVSIYASHNWFEDLAESVNSYCLQKVKLEQISPAKFQFIQDRIFHGGECKQLDFK